VWEKALATITPQSGPLHRLLAAYLNIIVRLGAPGHPGLVVDPGHGWGMARNARHAGPAPVASEPRGIGGPRVALQP